MGSSAYARSYTPFAFWLSMERCVDDRDSGVVPVTKAVVEGIVVVIVSGEVWGGSRSGVKVVTRQVLQAVVVVVAVLLDNA